MTGFCITPEETSHDVMDYVDSLFRSPDSTDQVTVELAGLVTQPGFELTQDLVQNPCSIDSEDIRSIDLAEEVCNIIHAADSEAARRTALTEDVCVVHNTNDDIRTGDVADAADSHETACIDLTEEDDGVHQADDTICIDLTQTSPVVSIKSQRRGDCDSTTGSTSYRRQILLSPGPIDIETLPDDAEAGASSWPVPPKKRRYIPTADSSPIRSEPKAEPKRDTDDRSPDNGASWTNSQFDAWERSSWADDENESSIRGRQTPYPYLELADVAQTVGDSSDSDEDDEEVLTSDLDGEEETGDHGHNVDPYMARIDALQRSQDFTAERLAAIHDSVVTLSSKLSGVNNNVEELFAGNHGRMDVLFGGVHNKIRLLHNSIEVQFATIHYRLDAYEANQHELLAMSRRLEATNADIIRRLNVNNTSNIELLNTVRRELTNVDNTLRSMQLRNQEYFTHVRNGIEGILRERQLLVTLLGAITDRMLQR